MFQTTKYVGISHHIVWKVAFACAVMLLFSFPIWQVSLAHASPSTPTVTLSQKTSIVGKTITVTGTGFLANETVGVRLDTTPTGTTQCDAHGMCTASVTLSSDQCLVNGAHTVTMAGQTSLLLANAPIQIRPSVQIEKTISGPGGPFRLVGTGFQSQEQVTLVFGTSTDGPWSTDTCGRLTIYSTVPANSQPGSYDVKVVRSPQQKPTTVHTTYRVPAPTITAPAGVRSGQTINIVLLGFHSGEQVTLSWDANGGQSLPAPYMDEYGSSGTTPPSTLTLSPAPAGTYTMTAIGEQSGVKATHTITVGPGIELLTPTASPGSQVTVSGGGFTPGETITTQFKGTGNTQFTAIADATGSFTSLITAPVTYDPTRSYTVISTNASGTERAHASFTFTPPSFSYLDWDGLTYGSSITFTGVGFAANEKIVIYWNYQQTGQQRISETTAFADGSFAAVGTVPSDPDLSQTNVAIIGESSHISLVKPETETGAVILDPPYGAAGVTLHVTGGGFGSQEQVNVLFQGTVVQTLTSAVDGSIDTTLTLSPTLGSGQYTITATGQTSAVTSTATYTVQPTFTFSPDHGPTGTTITVTGDHYTPNSSVTISWGDYNDPNWSTTTLATFSTDSTGHFHGTVTVPTVQAGYQYDLLSTDNTTFLGTDNVFVGQ